MNSPNHSSHDLSALDSLTGGALTASTSSERLHRVREWLNTGPSLEVLQQVFKELSSRDKGAAKPVKEKIDDMRRAKNQDALSQEWAEKAQALLNASRLNVADAMAWARDSAKAGAPLSREPLASLRTALADRVKHIEELAHRAQVLRESALLMAQRIEVLSTKSWVEAEEMRSTLADDLARLESERQALSGDAHWQSVDPKYPASLNEGAQHIQVVWDAFSAALEQTRAAAEDSSLPLPGVPAWADQLRLQRGEPAKAAAPVVARPSVDPALQAQAKEAVQALLQQLQEQLSQGHAKATSAAAAALKQALKTHARALDHELENQAQQALTKANELEGWQRWRADQLRTELLSKAQGLLRPVKTNKDAATDALTGTETDASPVEVSPVDTNPVDATEAASDKSEVTAWEPVITGRKLQDTLRQLREAWKQTDQGGQPNHALWKKFDQACNRAYPFVQAWLEKAKAESQAHKEQRLALLAEVAAWTQANASNTDWKKQARELHQFSERWRTSGHLSEKAFAEMQAQWKAAMSAAHAGLEQAQQASVTRRRAMIDEAKQLAAAPSLRVDAVKSLQQRWQAESQAIVLDRKLAQKLWDAFRQPLDEAFQRKSQERTAHAQALSAHDQAVLDASQALEKTIAQGDASQIRLAMQHLSAVINGTALASQNTTPDKATVESVDAQPAAEQTISNDSASVTSVSEPVSDAPTDEPSATVQEPAPVVVEKPPAVVKKVVAVRGDDRPGQKKTEPVAAGRFGDKPGARRNERDVAGRRSDAPPSRGHERGKERELAASRGPRLGDAAFRAQRHAIEQAEMALKKLAMQAHGETLVHLLTAWQHRQADQLPAAKELGSRVNPAQRQAWVQALQAGTKGEAEVALLRLEMAAEVNTPAQHQQARRQLQLQLLTKRHEAPPIQTWAQDVTTVLQSAHSADAAQRLQAVLRVLLKR